MLCLFCVSMTARVGKCPICNQEFSKTYPATYCSRKCYGKTLIGRMYGANNPSKKLEVIEKIKKALTGKRLSPEHRQKLSEFRKLHPTKYWLGKKRPEMNGNKFRKGKSPSTKGKKGLWTHTDEYKKFMSEHMKSLGNKPPTLYGKDNWNWKGGVTPVNEKIRKSNKYITWRNEVFQRDNYTCQMCGIKNGLGKTIKLNADHIKPFSLYPDLRLELSNGRTLCQDCHKKTETFGVKLWRSNV